jgi:hypothetical protein
MSIKNLKHQIAAACVLITLFMCMQSCAALKKNGCGCANKKNMVGY